jgi:hypothetical protein
MIAANGMAGKNFFNVGVRADSIRQFSWRPAFSAKGIAPPRSEAVAWDKKLTSWIFISREKGALLPHSSPPPAFPF